MKIHVLSDLHTEFADFTAPNVNADVVVLAGDIGVGFSGLDWAVRQFPVGELEREFDGPTVVVTHHLPATSSVAKRYVNDPLNPAFASRLEDVIEKYQPVLWIHGHTHAPCDYKIFGTRVVCNPRGYPSDSSGDKFAADLVVHI